MVTLSAAIDVHNSILAINKENIQLIAKIGVSVRLVIAAPANAALSFSSTEWESNPCLIFGLSPTKFIVFHVACRSPHTAFVSFCGVHWSEKWKMWNKDGH